MCFVVVKNEPAGDVSIRTVPLLAANMYSLCTPKKMQLATSLPEVLKPGTHPDQNSSNLKPET
jgi:hypothetical protein